jgi:hypothetical protein
MKSIILKNLELPNILVISKILNRSIIDLNENDILEMIVKIILIRINFLKHKVDTSENPIYKHTYNNNTILQYIFCEELLDVNNLNLSDSDSIINKKIITALTLEFGNLNFSYYKNSLFRSKLVRPLNKLEKYYSMLKLCIDYGLDLSKKYKGFTLYDIYMDGCYPIQLLQPNMHNLFVKLFNRKI